MWNEETEKELDFLTDEIEWDLKAINEGSVVINTKNGESKEGSDLAIEMAKDSLRLAELLKIYDDSVQYDLEADK